MSNTPKHKWSIEAKQRLKKFRTTPEYIESVSGKNSPSWKGGVSRTGKVSYDIHEERFPPHIPVRRDPSNNYVLQTKCMGCDNWFSPNRKVTNRKLSGQRSLKFFCSTDCSNKRYKKKILIIKTSMYRDIVKHNKKLQKVNKKIRLEKQKKFTRIKQLGLRRKKIEYTKKYGKYAVKRKRKNRLIQKFKKCHPNRYIKYKHSNASLWFEIKRWQDPSEWRMLRILVMSKSRAKELNLEFNLDKEWCRKRMFSCEATGIKFNNRYEDTFISMNPYAASIDRINSTKGYTKNNCRLVLTMFNSLKSTLTDEELYINLKKFVTYYEKTHNL